MARSKTQYQLIFNDPLIHKWQMELGAKSWPEFMQHDAIVEKYWSQLYEAFQSYQFGLHDGDTPIAIANSIPLHWEGDERELPEEGLDWAMEKAAKDLIDGRAANMLIAVQILVNPAFRGKQISYFMLESMKDLARKNGIYNMALPVRPTLKHNCPDTSMEEYVLKKNEKGDMFDPWLRTHMSSGGQIQGVCARSMTITGTVDEWQEWTGKKFPASGTYTIPYALVPISINIEKDIGVYLEPNVWITYKLDI